MPVNINRVKILSHTYPFLHHSLSLFSFSKSLSLQKSLTPFSKHMLPAQDTANASQSLKTVRETGQTEIESRVHNYSREDEYFCYINMSTKVLYMTEQKHIQVWLCVHTKKSQTKRHQLGLGKNCSDIQQNMQSFTPVC